MTEAYRRLWDATVASLTAAVELEGDPDSEGYPTTVDFADFVASALAAVAANVGSAGRLTAGRPGSWESELVAQLVTGTVGGDPPGLRRSARAAELAPWRTLPVVVPLNVAEMLDDDWQDAEQRKGLLPPYDEALAQLREREDAPAEALLAAQYRATYRAYADAFAAAVSEEAAAIGIKAPVVVVPQTEPNTWWLDRPNPGDDSDPLARTLWSRAHARVPLPTTLVEEIPAADPVEDPEDALMTGVELAALRASMGLSPVELADAVGTTSEFVTRWEAGDEVPTETARRVWDLVGNHDVEVEDLRVDRPVKISPLDPRLHSRLTALGIAIREGRTAVAQWGEA